MFVLYYRESYRDAAKMYKKTNKLKANNKDVTSTHCTYSSHTVHYNINNALPDWLATLYVSLCAREACARRPNSSELH
jgi:hypothetical protein